MVTFTKDVNFRISAKNLLKHSWLSKEVEQKSNTSGETSDFNRDAHDIDEYNKKLEEMSVQKPENEEREIHTITKAMAEKFKQQKRKSEVPQDEKTTDSKRNSQKPAPKKQVTIHVEEEEEEEDFGFSFPTVDAQKLKESLAQHAENPQDMFNFDVDNLEFEREEDEFEVEFDINALKNKLEGNDFSLDDEWPEDNVVAVPSFTPAPKAKVLKDYSEDKEEMDFASGFELGQGLKLVTNRMEADIEWVRIKK